MSAVTEAHSGQPNKARTSSIPHASAVCWPHCTRQRQPFTPLPSEGPFDGGVGSLIHADAQEITCELSAAAAAALR